MMFSLLVGLFVALIAHFAAPFLVQNVVTIRILQLLIVFSITNVALAIFNLIPCYPLDGYQILYTLLPSRQAVGFARSARYGPFIILALFFLLPLIGNLAGSSLFLFRLASFFLELAANITNPIIGLVTVPPGILPDTFIFSINSLPKIISVILPGVTLYFL
jgi:Zn-dependent protease